MLLTRLALVIVAATLAGADNATLSTTSTPSSPSTPPPLEPLAPLVTDAPLTEPSNATTPSCTCFYNEKRQQTELVCEASEDLVEFDFVHLAALLHHNCTYVLVEVSNHNLEVIEADSFVETPQLQYIYLSSDFIDHIDSQAFQTLQDLVAVDLSDNRLLSVDPRLFVDNSHLTSVSLAGNPLVELKSNAPILDSASITILDLSLCKLTSLSVESFSKLPNLRRLDLSSNNIKQLQVTVLQSIPQLNALNIANNRWTCDCAFKNVVDFARNMEETDVRRRCFNPDKIVETWSVMTAEKYCVEQQYDDSLSAEYDYDYEHEDAKAIEAADNEKSDLLEMSSDLQKDTDDLRQEMNVLLNADTEGTEVDETPDADESADEVLFVIEGDDSDTSVDIYPVALLVFVLTALVVFIVGVAMMLCRIAIRRNSWPPSFNRLVEEGGEAVYVKVPLE